MVRANGVTISCLPDLTGYMVSLFLDVKNSDVVKLDRAFYSCVSLASGKDDEIAYLNAKLIAVPFSN